MFFDNKMKKTILPTVKPPIVSYLYHAYPLSITLLYHDTMPLIFSNYIQLISNMDYFSTRRLPIDYFMQSHFLPHWIDLESTTRNEMVSNEDYLLFLKTAIDRNQYIYTFANDYFIQGRPSYLKVDTMHDQFIFGYDDSKQVFHVIGFVDRIFSESEVSYCDMKKALDLNQNIPILEYQQNIHLLSFNSSANTGFNRQQAKQFLLDYIHSENTYKRLGIPEPNYPCLYGADVYKFLHLYFKELIQSNTTFDIRPFHILFEHKKMMWDRLKYMEQQQLIDRLDLSTQFFEVFRESHALRDETIKYEMTGDMNHLVIASEKVEPLFMKEIKVYQQLINYL